MKTKLALGAAIAAMAFAAPAQAEIIDYDVTDATSASCPHGLWTNTVGSGCTKKWSFQDGTTFSVDTDTGTGSFTGTAINSLGQVATLDLSLSGLLDTLDGTGFTYKDKGGPYDPSTQDYFSSAFGTIALGSAIYSLNPADPLAGTTTFQFGPGANDKTSDFGGSAWLNILDPHNNPLAHWDINFDLTRAPTQVPAPAGLALFGLGLLGAWGARRQRRKVAA